MSGAISNYKLFSGHGRIHDLVRDLGEKKAPEDLLKFILGGSKENCALNQSNVKRVTDLLGDIFETYQNEFDRRDIESLRTIQTTLTQMGRRGWKVWKNIDVRETVTKINSTINTILDNNLMPNPIANLILEYAPKEARELKGMDDAAIEREFENIGPMTPKTVSLLKDSQIEMLGIWHWIGINNWDRNPRVYEILNDFFASATDKQRNLLIESFEKEFEARYFTEEKQDRFINKRYWDILGTIGGCPDFKVLHCRDLIKNLMNVIGFVGDNHDEVGKFVLTSCIFNMVNNLEILHVNKCDGLKGYFTALPMRNLKELSLQDGSAQSFKIADFERLSITAPKLKILDLQGNQFSKEFEEEIRGVLPHVNVIFGPTANLEEKDDGN